MRVLRIVIIPVVGLVVGVVVGALGSVAHWGHRPWGLVAALALVLASATMMRAWAGRAALAALVVGLGAALVVLSRPGPSSSALIKLSTTSSLVGPDPGVYGRIWVIGSVVVAALVAVAPAFLFSDRPPVEHVHDEEPRPILGEMPGEATGGTPPTGSVGSAD